MLSLYLPPVIVTSFLFCSYSFHKKISSTVLSKYIAINTDIIWWFSVPCQFFESYPCWSLPLTPSAPTPIHYLYEIFQISFFIPSAASPSSRSMEIALQQTFPLLSLFPWFPASDYPSMDYFPFCTTSVLCTFSSFSSSAIYLMSTNKSYLCHLSWLYFPLRH